MPCGVTTPRNDTTRSFCSWAHLHSEAYAFEAQRQHEQSSSARAISRPLRIATWPFRCGGLGRRRISPAGKKRARGSFTPALRG